MFKPKYCISKHALEHLSNCEVIISKIKDSNIRLPLELKLEKQALIAKTQASTSIEGNTLSIDQIEEIEKKSTLPNKTDREGIEVANYIQALKWIHEQKKNKITESKLLRLHRIVTQKLLDKERSGQYKTKVNKIINEHSIPIFFPPGPEKTKALICDLLCWLHSEHTLHPIIKSAIFHHQFVTIHPFSDGNGRMARLSAYWILIQDSPQPFSLTDTDSYFANDRKTYYEKIQQTRDLDYDFTYWIDYVAEAYNNSLETLLSNIQSISKSANRQISITPKQLELIALFKENSRMGSKEISKALNVNRARVNQLISPLIKAKIIQREGKARATRYSLKK